MATNNTKSTTTMSLSLDYRIVIVALLVVIAVMFGLWQPWSVKNDDRTIKVTGQATVKATPDEFLFYPSYQFVSADKQGALTKLTAKSDEVVAKLKELGVADKDIKTNSSGYDYPMYKESNSEATYTLSITVTVDTKEMAQKVQDYLVTTTPLGSVSPQATFSDQKRTQVENDARDKATKDARAKAEQSAKNLGFSLGSVKSVDDDAGFGGIAYPATGMMSADMQTTKQLSVQPGENDLNYSVTVTYFVR